MERRVKFVRAVAKQEATKRFCAFVEAHLDKLWDWRALSSNPKLQPQHHLGHCRCLPAKYLSCIYSSKGQTMNCPPGFDADQCGRYCFALRYTNGQDDVGCMTRSNPAEPAAYVCPVCTASTRQPGQCEVCQRADVVPVLAQAPTVLGIEHVVPAVALLEVTSDPNLGRAMNAAASMYLRTHRSSDAVLAAAVRRSAEPNVWARVYNVNMRALGMRTLNAMEVGGGGQCFFLSLAEALTGARHLPFTTRAENAQYLREQAVAALERSPDRLAMAMIERNDYAQNKPKCDATSYGACMRRPTEYVDSVLATAAANEMAVVVVIFNVDLENQATSVQCVGERTRATDLVVMVRPGHHYQVGGMTLLGFPDLMLTCFKKSSPLGTALCDRFRPTTNGRYAAHHHRPNHLGKPAKRRRSGVRR